LVDGQGNFGSIDGDMPAAYRYTEARLRALAEVMMADLEKETVDFRPNFDETTEEPFVLPTPFPNLLVNGSTGIAVGMATNIPPHNMREVIDGVLEMIERRGQSAEERVRALYQAVPGPDCPAGRRVGGLEGGSRLDRHHRDSLSGQQEGARRRDRLARAREEDRGHLGPARRVEP